MTAVIGLTAVNYRGITRTAGLARVLVTLSIAALAVFVAVAAGRRAVPRRAAPAGSVAGVYGVLQSAGLLFFAFAGYARIATLGEEVRDPARTIPRAIPLALGITVVIYLAVGIAALAAAGAEALAGSSRPLATAVEAVNAAWALPVVQAGAAVAMRA